MSEKLPRTTLETPLDQPSRSWCARPPHPCPRRPAAAHAVAGVGCVSYRLVACHRSLVHGSKERMSQTWYPHGKWRQQSPAAAAAHPWPEPQRGGDAARRTPEAANKKRGAPVLRCVRQAGEKAQKAQQAQQAPPVPPIRGRSGSQPLRGDEVGSDASLGSRNLNGAVAEAHIHWIFFNLSYMSLYMRILCNLFNRMRIAGGSGCVEWPSGMSLILYTSTGYELRT